MPRFAIVLLALLAAPSVSPARMWHVFPDGSGDAPTIAAAIDSSSAPDTIAVHPGTYFEDELQLKGGTSLLGVGGLSAGVVLTGEPTSTILWVSEDAATLTTVRGIGFSGANDGLHQDGGVVRVVDCAFDVSYVALRNHRGQLLVADSTAFRGGYGGVIGTAPLEISNCTFEQAPHGVISYSSSCLIHRSTVEAGYYAIQVNESTAEIFDSTVRGAQVGLSARFSQADVRRSRFEDLGTIYVPVPPDLGLDSPACGLEPVFPDDRRTRFPRRDRLADRGLYYAYDGAVIVEPWSSATFEDCDFVDNRSSFGGAIENWGIVSMDACRFDGNAAVDSGGSLFVGRYQDPGSAQATNCTFTRGSAPNGSAVAVGWGSVHLDKSILAFETNPQPIAGPNSAYATCSNLYANGTDIPDGRLRRLLDTDSNFSADPWFCGPDDVSIAALSLCTPGLSPCGTLIGGGEVACYPEGVYVDARPSGLSVLGDGEARPGAALFAWNAGETHQISAPDSQVTASGQLYVFHRWDDGGARTHDVNVVGPGVVATAEYRSVFHLAMEADPGGSVTPASSDWLEGSVVPVEAVPDSGHVFVRWWSDGPGGYTGPDAAHDVEMLGHVTQHAVFAPSVPVLFSSVPPGRMVAVNGIPYVTPVTVEIPISTWAEIDASAPQEVAPGSRYRFESWSDGGTAVHSIVVTEPAEFVVTYALQHELTMDDDPRATLLPGSGWYDAGAIVAIEAVPDYEWAFLAWAGAGDGAYSGTDNPASVTMNGPVHEVAVIQSAFEGHGYDFTISASSTDPFAQESPPAGGVRNLYLWGTCLQRGLAALEAQVTGTIPVLGFSPAPGVLNAGSATHLFMAVGGCPSGPESNTLLGHWIVLDDAGGTLCLGPPDDAPIAVADCTPVTPLVWPDPGVTGFSSDGSPPCRVGANACLEDPVLVELSGLQAVAVEGAVAVSWSTALETNHDGFHVYRSELGEGTPTRRTDGMIRGRSPYSWLDRDVRPDHTYRYWIHAIDVHGRVQRFGPVEVTTPARVAAVTRFAGPRPTPFRGRCRLAFSLAEAGRVELEIHDVTGRRVRRYIEHFPAGEQVVEWDARADDGRAVPGGVYFATFRAGDVKETRKIVLLPGR